MARLVNTFLPLLSLLLIIACTGEPEEQPEPDQPQKPFSRVYLSTGETLDNSTKKSCFITWVQANGDTLFDEMHAKVKLRGEGHGALKFEKSSYTFKLSEARVLDSMPKEKDWILNAAYIDKSLVRTKLSYDLFRAMSAKNVAPQTSWVELWFNDDYRGVYLLHEKMDATRMGVDKNDLGARIFKAPPLFMNGDYTRFLKTKTANFFDQRYPDYEVVNCSADAERLMRFIHESTDEAFGDSVNGLASMIDLDIVIDWHLLLIISNNTTGVFKNYYLYSQGSNDKWRIGIWDADRGYGRDGDNELNLDGFINIQRNVMLYRLMSGNHFDYNDRLRQRYLELKANGTVSLEALLQRIDVMDQTIGAHLDQNFEKWPANGPYYFDDSTYVQEIRLMKDWLTKRIPKVESYLLEAGD